MSIKQYEINFRWNNCHQEQCQPYFYLYDVRLCKCKCVQKNIEQAEQRDWVINKQKDRETGSKVANARHSKIEATNQMVSIELCSSLEFASVRQNDKMNPF